MKHCIKVSEEKDGGGFRAYWENGVFLGDIEADVDGFYKWWPAKNGGYFDEWLLLCMYNTLKGMNKKWQETIDNDPVLGLRNDDVQQRESI